MSDPLYYLAKMDVERIMSRAAQDAGPAPRPIAAGRPRRPATRALISALARLGAVRSLAPTRAATDRRSDPRRAPSG